MNRFLKALAVAGLCLAVVGSGWYFWPRPEVPSNPHPYTRTEFKHRTDESENSRTYTFVEEKLRQVEIRFADGSIGFRFLKATTPDGKSLLTSAEEIHDDKTRYVFDFDEKGVRTGTVAYRKDNTRLVKEEISPDNKLLRTFYGPDGEARMATLLLGDADYVFTVYEGSAGQERKLYVEEYSEPRNQNESGGPQYGGPTFSIAITVFQDGITPIYRQFWLGYNYEDEGGGGGGKLGGNNGGNNGEPQVVLAALEYFHEDSAAVRQRVVFNKPNPNNGGESEAGPETHLFDRDGKEVAVRYLSADYLVLKVVDKTKTPEVTVTNAPQTAPKEAIDAAHMKSPVSDAMAKLRDEVIMNGIGHLHLDRLTVD